eukprot:TRINITY_DN4268_c0_g1_i1.p1 TRINITY_DN4268_c0_g1~~TRINITY_DN4268_c0_g1_i1.p1  ORF type:complete len:674 (+),score=153.72 TRINITY_DN4268_c0_g1_i1:30-2024(+)
MDLRNSAEINKEFYENAIELDHQEDDDYSSIEIDQGKTTSESFHKTPDIEIILNSVGVKVKTGMGLKKVTKVILQNVSAIINPGDMIAIMGASGSGKTTLLNAIAGRSFGTKMNGQILVNGKDKHQHLINNAGYVMQSDALLSNLTVIETLTYAANLRLPASYSKQRKIDIVEDLIKQMGLLVCRDTIVGGDEKKGISGGQKKRVAIAQELLTNPSVVILDEPTSGLDSTTSANLTISLRKLSKKGKTIIATIHQPSASVFFTYDKLILLCGGNMAYYGTTKDVVEYFSKIGYQCPTFQNPSDFILDLITPGYKIKHDKKSFDSTVVAKHVVETYPEYAKNNNLEKFYPDSKYTNEVLKKPKEAIPPNAFVKFGILTKRAFIQAIREPTCTYARLIQNLFFGLIMGALYFKMQIIEPKVRNRLGGLYFVVLQNVLTNLISDLFTFPREREIYLREESNSAYSVLPYYFSKIVAELAFQIVIPLCYTPIVYYMFGLQNDASKFFIFAFNMVCVMHASIALAVAISSGLANFRMALLLTPVLYVPMNLLAGYLIKPRDIPKYLAWFRFLSPFKHGYEINVINEFRGLGNIPCPANTTCVYKNGEDVIKDNTDPGSHIWRSFLLQVALSCLFHLIAIICLKLNSRKPIVAHKNLCGKKTKKDKKLLN